MQVNSATTTTPSTAQTGTDNTTSLPTQIMSESDFLNLLVTQMTSQDPMNPIQNQDLLTQMVQFSTLQQNTNMQAALAQMQNSQSFAQANSLLGRAVDVQVDANTTTQGVVTGVDVSSGTPQIVVNGAPYALSKVLAVSNSSTNSSTPTTTATP